MNYLLLSVLLAVVAHAQTPAEQFSNGIRTCQRDHPSRLNECLMGEIREIQPALGAGIPELNIPQLEPLHLENIVFRQSEPPVTIEATFSNVLVSGITSFDLKYLDIDYQKTRKLSMGMVIPALTMRGQYTIGGNVFLLPIEGAGDFVTILDGVIVEGTSDIVPLGDRATMTNLNIGFKIRTMKTHMDNLFNGNQVLSDTIHHFMNQNGQLVLDQIRPGISVQLNDFVSTIFNSMFAALPVNLLEEVPNANAARIKRKNIAPPRFRYRGRRQ